MVSSFYCVPDIGICTGERVNKNDDALPQGLPFWVGRETGSVRQRCLTLCQDEGGSGGQSGVMWEHRRQHTSQSWGDLGGFPGGN